MLILIIILTCGCKATPSKNSNDGNTEEPSAKITLIVKLNDEKNGFIISGIERNFKKINELEIPSTYSQVINGVEYNDKPVKSIGEKAFKDINGIDSINIKADNITVENSAFENCKDLTNIKFNQDVSFGATAFKGCSKLTKIESKNVKSVADSTFENCTSLGSIEISGKIIGKNVFKGCTALKSVKMNNMVDIPEGLFDGCTSVTTVNIDKCQTIGKAALRNTGISGDLQYGEVTSVGESAFEGCTQITSISLPKAKTIEAKAFNNCTELSNIEMPIAESIGQSAFEGCTKITEINLNNIKDITNIGLLFKGNTSLKSVKMNNMVDIPEGLFDGCTSLTTVNIDKCQTIGKAALRNTGISGDLEYGEVTSVGESAFEGCTNITSISLPKAKTIEAKAFNNCTSLNKAVLPLANILGANGYIYNSMFSPIPLDDVHAIDVVSIPENNIIIYSCNANCKNRPKDIDPKIESKIMLIKHVINNTKKWAILIHLPTDGSISNYAYKFFSGQWKNDWHKIEIKENIPCLTLSGGIINGEINFKKAELKFNSLFYSQLLNDLEEIDLNSIPKDTELHAFCSIDCKGLPKKYFKGKVKVSCYNHEDVAIEELLPIASIDVGKRAQRVFDKASGWGDWYLFNGNINKAGNT